MIGGCLLRTFVIENEREEYRRTLEIALEREQEQFQELCKAWQLAYKDALTGVKSKLAYAEKIEQIDREIAKGIRQELALVVLDVNNLKRINDTLGHEVGDEYIKAACRLICDSFKKSPVYRVGGDEFVVFLEQEDYENREKLLAAFNEAVEENRQHDAVVHAVQLVQAHGLHLGVVVQALPQHVDGADALFAVGAHVPQVQHHVTGNGVGCPVVQHDLIPGRAVRRVPHGLDPRGIKDVQPLKPAQP
jgi:diguanylate cyclase (GGDEF)-like protein